jgi:hypothetical protein
MEHSEVREILEDAAVEPGGLERLMAGDTSTASRVAGHLAGCPECGAELERLRRSVALIAPVVRDVPPPELRERTLAFVAAVGRPRGVPLAEGGAVPSDRPAPAPASAPASRRRASWIGRADGLAPALGLAAALILAVAGTAVIANANRDSELRLQAAEIEALGDVARWTLRIDQSADAHRVALASTAAGSAGVTGQLLYSPTSTELVVVADGLVPPASGREYKCWVESGSKRSTIGKMFFGGDVAYWVGPVPEIAGLGADATFGVSLVDLTSPDSPGQPVLTGAG